MNKYDNSNNDSVLILLNAYPHEWNDACFQKIADQQNAYLMVDITIIMNFSSSYGSAEVWYIN